MARHTPCGCTPFRPDAERDGSMPALDVGADEYIAKPIQLREFTAQLRTAVRRRGARQTQINQGRFSLFPRPVGFL